MTAVYTLLGLKREPPPVYKGQYDPHVLFRASQHCTASTSESGSRIFP